MHGVGCPIVHEKTEGPASCLTFLDIELDSVAQQSRLSQNKLAKAVTLLRAATVARKLTLHELQVLVGHLNFACRIIAPG